MLYHKKPNMRKLHEWGNQVWVHTPSGTKLDGRSRIGRWIGYDEISNGHRIYWPDKRSVTVERSIKFANDEVVFPSNPIAKPIQGESSWTSENSKNRHHNPETQPQSGDKEYIDLENHLDDPDDSVTDQTK